MANADLLLLFISQLLKLMAIPTGATLSIACSTQNNSRSLSLWISIGFKKRKRLQVQGRDPTRWEFLLIGFRGLDLLLPPLLSWASVSNPSALQSQSSALLGKLLVWKSHRHDLDSTFRDAFLLKSLNYLLLSPWKFRSSCATLQLLNCFCWSVEAFLFNQNSWISTRHFLHSQKLHVVESYELKKPHTHLNCPVVETALLEFLWKVVGMAISFHNDEKWGVASSILDAWCRKTSLIMNVI